MPSKSCGQSLPGPGDDTALIQSCQWSAWKSVNSTAPLAVAASAGIPVRIFRDTSTDAAGSTDAANILLAHDLSAVTHLQICCESGRSLDPVWQTEVYYGLRNGGYGGTILVGALPTGNPTQITVVGNDPHFPELEPLYPLLRLTGIDLALDEYTGILSTDPRVPAWWPYTAQRHRLIVADLARQGIAVQVVITESGADNVQPEASGQGGWQARGWAAADYLTTLQALDAGDQADAAVLCRCVFASNPTPDWAAFDITPIAADLAAYVRAQAGVKMPDYSKATWVPSPNFWAGRQGNTIKALVLHGTAGPGAVSWFSNTISQVSAHYVVDVDGTVTQTVSEADSAWHAGVVTANSAYAGGPNPNLWTIGIEHVRDVTNTSPITPAQLAASLALVKDIVTRHGTLALILHDQIDVGRVCPGPNFPLQAFQDVVMQEGTVPDWPIINQLAQPDNNDANDCGPATADMIARDLGLVPVDETVRQVKLEETGNADWTGYTTTMQMQAWFASRGVPCLQVQTQDPAGAIADALATGWPVAYLRYGDVATKTGGHFVAAVPRAPLYTFANPWTGAYDLWSAADVNVNSLGGWLVIVQRAKEVVTVDDTLKAAAVARFSALGVQPLTDGALFKAYARMVDRWIKSGRDALTDPTPAIRPEWAINNLARLPLDNGIVLEWHGGDGITYQIEAKDRDAVFKECGW
jgi:N-acetyl-anhydromuramyl-L-alanine amidase AmpD